MSEPGSKTSAPLSDLFDREKVRREITNAYQERDWERLVPLIGLHWSLLFDEDPELLDLVLAAAPVEAFSLDARAAAVRDIRLHSSVDAVDRMLGSVKMPDGRDLALLDTVARSASCLSLLSTAASRMIALRVRGHHPQAAVLAELTDRFGHIALVHQPALIGPRLPSALLQVGITKGLADDHHGAGLALAEAFERSPRSRAQHVAKDAASKAAFFATVAGDFDSAAHWLEREEASPHVEGWHRDRVARTTAIARTLLAIESAEQDEAARWLNALERPVSSEQSWGPAVTYASARFAVAWGDPLGTLSTVRADRRRYLDWLGQGSLMGPLLAQAEADLCVSLGYIGQVSGALKPHGHHPLARVSEARAQAAIGSHDIAARIAAEVVAADHSPRARLDALAVQVVANTRGANHAAARRAFAHLSRGARDKQAHLIALTVGNTERGALEQPGMDRRSVREIIPPRLSFQLTKQQQLVLAGLADDKTLREIAAGAHLSTNTVKTHVRALYARLGAKTRDDAVAIAHSEGLL